MSAHSVRSFTAVLAVLAVGLALPSTAIARGQKHALIVHGTAEGFNREAAAFAAAAAARGYETSTFDVWSLPNRDAVLARIDSETASLSQGDRLLLTFNCHGMDVPGDVYFDPEAVRGHMTCRVKSDDIRDLVKELVQRGVEVVVFDNSCSGGATVELLEPLHACAIASVAPGLPSVVGFPHFSNTFRDSNRTRTFEDVAIEGQFEIFHRIPARIGQKAYYSTQSGLAQDEAVFRSAFSYAANSLSEFQLQGTALHRALRGGDEDRRARPKTIDQVLKRSTHYSEVLDRVMASVSSRWATSKGRSGQTQAALYQRAIAKYQREGLITPDLRVPATVDELHGRIRAEVDGVQQKRARLATLVDTWQRRGGGEDEIKEMQQDILQQDANVSVLMGISEFVDTNLDDSPCRIGI